MKDKINKKILFGIFCVNLLSFSNTRTQGVVSENNIININITRNEEKKGLELGTKGYARGENSITTGTNNIAIGTNAVATGGNETKETIEIKLKENKSRLDEIKKQDETVRNESKELEALRLRYNEILEAGNRVNALKISKQNAYDEYMRLKKEKEKLEEKSKAQLEDHIKKIDDFNNRLKAVEKIGNVDLSNDNDLEKKAAKFKTEVESGTKLNLKVEFYKDYIKSHYQALGDLRQNEIIKKEQRADYLYGNYNTLLGERNIKLNYGYSDLRTNEISVYITDEYMSLTTSDPAFYNKDKLKQVLGLEDKDFPTNRNFNNVSNLDTDVIDDDQMKTIKEDKQKFKKIINKAIDKAFEYHLKEKILTQDQINTMKNRAELKLDEIELTNEIANLQWKYEKDKNTNHLNEKDTKLKQLEKLKEKMNNVRSVYTDKLTDEDKQKYFFKQGDKYYTVYDYLNKKIEDWNKANIDDIKEKNKITTEKLTSELEKELGISKDAILEIEKNIQNAKDDENNAYNNYNNINISEKDLLLAQEFEEVNKKILAKEKKLLTATERLETLKRELTLNEFKDGENAIAFGNNTLASGKNSIAFGKGSIATSESGIAIGDTNLTTGKSSIAIGHANNTIGTNVIALGGENSVNGDNSIAIGNKNKVYGDNTFVLGNNNKVGTKNNKKKDIFILGSNIDASSNIENAIVLGNNSTPITNGLSIGSESHLRKIHFVEPGTISKTSNEAINGSQLYEIAKGSSKDIDVNAWKILLNVGDAVGNPLSIFYKDNSKTEIDLGKDGKLTTIHNLNSPKTKYDAANKLYVDNEIKKLDSGINNSIAISQIPQVAGNKYFSVGVGAAYNGGKAGSFAVGISGQDKTKSFVYRVSSALSTDLKWNIGLGFSYSIGEISKNKDLNLVNNKDLRLVNNKDLINSEKIKQLENMIKKLQEDVNISKVSSPYKYVIDKFEFNKSNLDSKKKVLLDKLVKIYDNTYEYEVIGYTDIKGKDKYNLLLGLKRANAVANYLMEKGIVNISIKSGGFNTITNGTDSLNRRVEINILKKLKVK